MIDMLKLSATRQEYDAGMAIYQRGALVMLQSKGDELSFLVDGDPQRVVRVGIGTRRLGYCGCQQNLYGEGVCRHIVAATLAATGDGSIHHALQHRAQRAGKALLSAMDQPLSQEAKVELEITIAPNAAGLRADHCPIHLSLRVGQQRMYVVRSILNFMRAFAQRQTVTFGKGFAYQPEWMRFSKTDTMILRILEEIVQVMDHTGGNGGRDPKWLDIPALSAKRLFQLLMARPFRLAVGDTLVSIPHVQHGPIQLNCTASMQGRDIWLNAQLPEGLTALTKDCSYIYAAGEVLHVPATQRDILAALLPHVYDETASFRFAPEDQERVVSELMPKLKRAGELVLGSDLSQRIVSRPLEAKVYLDRDGRAVTARVQFCYGDQIINPFAPGRGQEAPEQQQALLLMRDATGEQAVLDALAGAGFRVQTEQVYLSDPEAVYQFLSQGLLILTKTAQVFYSQDFQRMKPIRRALSGSLSLRGNRLELNLILDGTPVAELVPILEALRDQKRYFFLKDGALLDLSDIGQWHEVAEAVLEDSRDMTDEESSRLEDQAPGLALKHYRALYLTQLLESAKLPIAVEEPVAAMSRGLDMGQVPCPAGLRADIRPYQLRGFQWMASLSQLKMGGILADDMGLGKTLQVITLMLHAKQTAGWMPSIVVAPTSLVYNWQAEIARFAPMLKTLVLEGSQGARAQALEALSAPEAVDVLITSYALLRRDTQILAPYGFRYAILDEAQNIKNALSVGATAAKQLKAQTPLALTGTPMENHPGELWSVFDFVLPGYLGSFSQFMRRYGDGQALDGLVRRIRPFMMRRLKADVLPELPEKVETVLLAEMTPEQKRVYQAVQVKLRERVESLLKEKGANRSRIEVLAALTQLRQVCCHPALCLGSYSASSGKLDAMLDVLPGALEGGHRMLLFSQFTSMLKILERTLEAQNIRCLYLDGDTPVVDRLGLVERFNAGEGQVFLISLKAGGSGLNLTGADMVIHYDPWWNPAAEDQATDRAHRIGQTRSVQVVRLITRGSIEEQVMRLSAKKREIFDQLITAGEQMPTQLSETDIRALFEIL